MHFYWSYLAMRLGGDDVLKAAMPAKARGSRHDLRQSRRELQGARRPQAVPGRLAGHDLSAIGRTVRRRQGRDDPDGQLASSARRRRTPPTRRAFPTTSSAASISRRVAGGKGNPSDTLGGLNGWLVTEGLAEGGGRLPEVLLELENQRNRGRARASTSRSSWARRSAIKQPDPAPARRNVAGLELAPDLLRPGSSARRSARWSTTSRPISPPGG